MNINNPASTTLYSIEEAIKAYRKLSLKNIQSVIPDITVDQALTLQLLNETELTQTNIADLIFKDYASMTRITHQLIKKEYITKSTGEIDKRVSVLKITKKGEESLKRLVPIIRKNRKTALEGIPPEDLNTLTQTLKKITENCKK